MAWNDVASNQMVSFTDAQTGGFTLISGQSHVTSNQCMTKANVFAKYSASATASTNALASNQLMRKSFWTIPVVSYTYALANGDCSSTETPVDFYSNLSSIQIGMDFYNEPELITKFVNEFSQYQYYPAGNQVLTLDTSSTVIAISSCTSISYTQQSGYYDDPCGVTVSNIYLGSNGLYYTLSQGSYVTISSVTLYQYVGELFQGYEWNEFIFARGNKSFPNSIISNCAPFA